MHWHRPIRRRALDAFFLQLVDIGLAGVVLVAPLFMGGRHPLGRLVLVALVCSTSIAWMARQCMVKRACWRWSGGELLLLLALVLIVLQLSPLPQTWLLRLSPRIAEMLPLWVSGPDGNAQLGTWSTLSLVPAATCGGLVMFLTYAMLFGVIVQRVEAVSDIERLLRWMALGAGTMAVIALAQLFNGNGKYLWLYEHPYRHMGHIAKGAFINENHFAHFLALGIGPLIWWLYDSRIRRDRRKSFTSKGIGRRREWEEAGELLSPVALGVVAVAGLLSMSRGGVLAIGLAAAVTVAVYIRQSLLGKRSIVALVGVGLTVAIAIFVYGHESIVDELKTIGATSGGQDPIQLRRKLWAADLAAAYQFPIFGTGIGSHREIYPAYYADHAYVEFSHAESGYVQVFVESGIVGLVLLLLGIVTCGRWCLETFCQSNSSRTIACAGALLSTLSVSVLHSLIDFVWYIPACMSLAVLAVACICRVAQLTLPSEASQRGLHIPRMAWCLVVVALLAVSAVMIKTEIAPVAAAAHWDRFEAMAARAPQMTNDETQRHTTAQSMLRDLEHALARNPNDARANLKLAAVCLNVFETEQRNSQNQMELIQIRDAALASGFSSHAAQNRWLSAAIGKNRKYLDRALECTYRALRLCPLQGEGYLYLAALAFLQGPSGLTPDIYIDQALRVRPHNGMVLMAAGREATLAGDLPKALQFWKKAFHQDPDQQTQMIQLLAPRAAPSFFFEHFRPDVNALGKLFDQYQRAQRTDQAREVGQHYVAQIESEAQRMSDEDAAALWRKSQSIYTYLDDQQRALECARRIVQLQPNDFAGHRNLADVLLEQEQFEEAIVHIRWCLGRNPDSKELREELKSALKRRMQHQLSAKLHE